MKKYILTIFTLTVFSLNTTFGQTKSFNGRFNSLNFQGTATYSYNEKPDKRIFNGPFTFKTTNNKVKISGNFQNDLKHGIWKVSILNVPHSELVMKYIISANASGTFNNGNLVGEWNLSRTKVFTFSDNGITDLYKGGLNFLSYLVDGKSINFKKTGTATEVSKANFKNNHFIGSFSYSINSGKSSVTGSFNNSGYFDNSWLIYKFKDGIRYLQTRVYKNGVLAIVKNKDNSTGQVVTEYDNEAQVNEFFQNYDSLRKASKIGNTYYKLKNEKHSENEQTLLSEAIGTWFNNSSLTESAYQNEIEKGSNTLTLYPENIISVDEYLTDSLEKEERRVFQEKLEAQKILDREKERLAIEERNIERERVRSEERKKEAEELEKRKILIAKQKQEQERIREEEDKIRAFENSSFGEIQKSIKIDFQAWLEKGEFESSEDHIKRTKGKWQTELDKISSKQILKSKENATQILSGTLSEYNVDSQAFSVNLFTDYSRVYSIPIWIKIPKNLAPYLKSKFGFQSASNGSPLAVHITEVSMKNNNWSPSRIIVLFPHGAADNGSNQGYYAPHLWDRVKIVPSGEKKYRLEYRGNIQIKSIKLKNIENEFSDNSLGDGVFFYEWNSNSASSDDLKFTAENIGVTIPLELK